MALYGAFDQTKHLEELDTPLVAQDGVLTPATRKARVLANLGITAEGWDPDLDDTQSRDTQHLSQPHPADGCLYGS